MSDDLAYGIVALSQIHEIVSVDPVDENSPGALIELHGYEGFARLVVDEVKQLDDDARWLSESR
jgi:hypothetical protein